MAERKQIEAGDKFTLNCGVEVVVTSYENSLNVVITDGTYTKTTTARHLRSGCVSWVEDGKKIYARSATRAKRGEGKRKRQIKLPKKYEIGATFENEKYGSFTILEVNPKVVVQFKNTGFINEYSRINFRVAGVKDLSTHQTVSQMQWPVGSVYYSKNHGPYTIINVEKSKNITIQWHESGHIQTIVAHQLRQKSIRDLSRSGNYLSAEGHYVYYASHDGRLVYIGKGKELRYVHCTSGVSANFILNKLFFEGIVVNVAIACDKLTDSEARLIEQYLIAKLKPYANVATPLVGESTLLTRLIEELPHSRKEEIIENFKLHNFDEDLSFAQEVHLQNDNFSL